MESGGVGEDALESVSLGRNFVQRRLLTVLGVLLSLSHVHPGTVMCSTDMVGCRGDDCLTVD